MRPARVRLFLITIVVLLNMLVLQPYFGWPFALLGPLACLAGAVALDAKGATAAAPGIVARLTGQPSLDERPRRLRAIAAAVSAASFLLAAAYYFIQATPHRHL